MTDPVRLALTCAKAALLECKPCAHPECSAIQQDGIDTAIAAIERALAALTREAEPQPTRCQASDPEFGACILPHGHDHGHVGAPNYRPPAAEAEPQARDVQPDDTRDAARLDWLERLFERKWDGTLGRPSHWYMAGPYRHTLQKMRGPTFRAAIDAAMSSPATAGEQEK